MPVPKPRYSVFDGLSMAIALGLRAIEEIRVLASNPVRQGPPGENGRGISEVAMLNGDLIVTFDDGKKMNVGRVAGEAGKDGGRGPSGLAGKDAPEIDIVYGQAVSLSPGYADHLREVEVIINGRPLRLLTVE